MLHESREPDPLKRGLVPETTCRLTPACCMVDTSLGNQTLEKHGPVSKTRFTLLSNKLYQYVLSSELQLIIATAKLHPFDRQCCARAFP